VSATIILIVVLSEHVTESSHFAAHSTRIFTAVLISRSHLMSGLTAASSSPGTEGEDLPSNSQLQIGYVTRQGLPPSSTRSFPLHLYSVYEARFQLLFAGKKKCNRRTTTAFGLVRANPWCMSDTFYWQQRRQRLRWRRRRRRRQVAKTLWLLIKIHPRRLLTFASNLHL